MKVIFPKNRKPKLCYKTAQYTTYVWWNKKEVVHYLVDDSSSYYPIYVLTFPRLGIEDEEEYTEEQQEIIRNY